MSEVATEFRFEGNPIRIWFDSAQKPWFNAADLCEAVGLKNVSQALNTHVGKQNRRTLFALDRLGRSQASNYLNEVGVHRVLLKSRKQKAREFLTWVSEVVLPMALNWAARAQ